MTLSTNRDIVGSLISERNLQVVDVEFLRTDKIPTKVTQVRRFFSHSFSTTYMRWKLLFIPLIFWPQSNSHRVERTFVHSRKSVSASLFNIGNGNSRNFCRGRHTHVPENIQKKFSYKVNWWKVMKVTVGCLGPSKILVDGVSGPPYSATVRWLLNLNGVDSHENARYTFGYYNVWHAQVACAQKVREKKRAQIRVRHG